MKIEKYIELGLRLDLKLKPGTINGFTLFSNVYPKGIKFSFIGDNYNSKLLGYYPREITLPEDYNYYDLFEGNRRIMSSSPELLFSQYVPYVCAKGNVLVGGFGLGIYSRLLTTKESIKSITVIESNIEIIELCRFEHSKLEIIHDDISSFIKESDLSQYDFIYIDIFGGFDNITYSDKIIPIKKFLIENYPTVPFHFWMEEEFKARYLKEIFNAEEI